VAEEEYYSDHKLAKCTIAISEYFAGTHTSLLFIGFGFLGVDLRSFLFGRDHHLLARLLCSLLGLSRLWLLGVIGVFGCAQFELSRRLRSFSRL
jgi:uncharacterized membrane protein YuzA (DUF378 family)